VVVECVPLDELLHPSKPNAGLQGGPALHLSAAAEAGVLGIANLGPPGKNKKSAITKVTLSTFSSVFYPK
jgi:hypothetical protein